MAQAAPGGDGSVVQVMARRRYRFRRRHTPHFYLVTTSLTLATVTCLVDSVAFVTRSVLMGEVAFGVLGITCISVLASYFWGFFMVMDGNIPMARIKIFLPHAIVGTLSPLIYMFNLSIAFDSVGARPLQLLSLICAGVSLAVLIVQYSMGRHVVRVDRLRVLRPHPVLELDSGKRSRG